MTFLVGLASSVLEWFLSKILSVIGEEIATYEQDQAIKAQAQVDQTKVQNATTPTEVATAATSVAADTFKQ